MSLQDGRLWDTIYTWKALAMAESMSLKELNLYILKATYTIMADKIEVFYQTMINVSKKIIDDTYPKLTDSEKLPHVVKLADIIIAVELRKGDSQKIGGLQDTLNKLVGKVG